MGNLRNASYTGRIAPPGYPNTVDTPSPTNVAQTISAPVRRVGAVRRLSADCVFGLLAIVFSLATTWLLATSSFLGVADVFVSRCLANSWKLVARSCFLRRCPLRCARDAIDILAK